MTTSNTAVPFAAKCKHLGKVCLPLCRLRLFTCFSCFCCRLGLALESAATAGTLALLPSGRQGAALFLPPAASLAVVSSISGAGRRKSRTHTEGLVSLKYVPAKRSAVLRMRLSVGHGCLSRRSRSCAWAWEEVSLSTFLAFTHHQPGRWLRINLLHRSLQMVQYLPLPSLLMGRAKASNNEEMEGQKIRRLFFPWLWVYVNNSVQDLLWCPVHVSACAPVGLIGFWW